MRLIVGASILLFFSSLLWLTINYHHTERPRWKLLSWEGSGSGGATEIAIMLSKEGLLPVACAMWAWMVAAAAVILSMDCKYEHHAGDDEEADVAGYAIGTPHDPRARLQQRQEDIY